MSEPVTLDQSTELQRSAIISRHAMLAPNGRALRCDPANGRVKVKFPSLTAGETAVRELRMCGSNVRRAYVCPRCHCCHVTSEEGSE